MGRKINDLSGRRFGNLDVLRLDEVRMADDKRCGKSRGAYWICRCGLCGRETSTRANSLVTGKATMCFLCRQRRISQRYHGDMVDGMVGKVYGNFRVIGTGRYSDNRVYYVCECVHCGRTRNVSRQRLTASYLSGCKHCG